MRALRVAVAGGGLGGLCLAQGLLRAGADGVRLYFADGQEAEADVAVPSAGPR